MLRDRIRRVGRLGQNRVGGRPSGGLESPVSDLDSTGSSSPTHVSPGPPQVDEEMKFAEELYRYVNIPGCI